MPIPVFPGRLISVGESDASIVTMIQTALRQRGYGPLNAGQFDAQMKSVVMTFQSQNVDRDGHALVVDGKVGLHTWGALFTTIGASAPSPPSAVMLQALAIAIGQVGQMEVPLGSNRGPMVDEYLRSTGIDPTKGTADQRAWCMAFVYWCFLSATHNLGVPDPLPRTAGCLDHWNSAKNVAGAVRVTAKAAYADPSLIKPGLIFILDFGAGLGHTGIVESLQTGGGLVTIEGNTNADGSRTGVGVFRLNRRKLSDATLKGFVDYTDS